MYLSFFNLKKKPFENICDTAFFYESDSHKEAYSRMKYVIENNESCALLTGGYGTGKTLILKKLEMELFKKGYVFSFITNPVIDGVGLLKLITHNFVTYKTGDTKADILIALEKFIKDTKRDGKHCVIIIDESQNITNHDVFEELRMLLNYQMSDKNLITLILSGQSELIENISSNKQFMQRIFLSYDIKPLNLKETQEYVIHRFTLSGGDADVFDNCFDILYERSGGIPRWINNICSMSLLTAFSNGTKKIDENIIEQAYRSIKGEV